MSAENLRKAFEAGMQSLAAATGVGLTQPARQRGQEARPSAAAGVSLPEPVRQRGLASVPHSPAMDLGAEPTEGGPSTSAEPEAAYATKRTRQQGRQSAKPECSTGVQQNARPGKAKQRKRMKALLGDTRAPYQPPKKQHREEVVSDCSSISEDEGDVQAARKKRPHRSNKTRHTRGAK
ncbi:hypothetical protein BaRGS_00034408 [Batillaria attramentaria]|uniref:Uncharacterized protein n=1 Tax=Batillaria attramentaria TaxID=370345 RepID=A0ABD0JI05_9CAEN